MAKEQTASTAKHETYLRFSVPQRLEHILLIASFTTLGFTGLIQKYSAAPIADFLISLLGGIELVRIIHRIAAITFALEGIYHIVVVGYKVFVQRVEMTMLPGPKDAIDALDVIRVNLGLTKEHPKLPRYNFAEKAEYWAMLWGAIMMGLTGFILWNPIATANFLPGQFIPAAKAAHGGEAVLAVLAILVWHFYNVHLKMFNKAMFTGKMTRHQMEEEHGAELAERMSNSGRPAANPAGVRRRERVYLPIAAVSALALVVGLYWLATFEQTAVAVVPAPATEVPVFAPLTTPTPIPAATLDNSQLGKPIPHPVAGQENCLTCHAVGGTLPIPANHAGRPVESCQICHAAGAATATESGGPKAIPANHDLTSDTYRDCTMCHGEGKIKPSPASHATYTADSCATCHKSTASAAPPEAAASGPKAIPANHDLTSDSYRDCTLCHGEGKIKPSPASHATYTADSCTICHKQTASAATPEASASGTKAIPHPIEGDAYRDCTTCHGAGKLKPFPANHTSFATDSCTTCHKPPAASGGTQTTGGPTTPHPIVGDAYKDCTVCHGADKVKPFPANHAGFTVDSCTACHQSAP